MPSCIVADDQEAQGYGTLGEAVVPAAVLNKTMVDVKHRLGGFPAWQLPRASIDLGPVAGLEEVLSRNRHAMHGGAGKKSLDLEPK